MASAGWPKIRRASNRQAQEISNVVDMQILLGCLGRRCSAVAYRVRTLVHVHTLIMNVLFVVDWWQDSRTGEVLDPAMPILEVLVSLCAHEKLFVLIGRGSKSSSFPCVSASI